MHLTTSCQTYAEEVRRGMTLPSFACVEPLGCDVTVLDRTTVYLRWARPQELASRRCG